MDSTQAKSLIKDTFEKPFDKGRFLFLVKNILNSFDESKSFPKPFSGQLIKEAYRDAISSFDRIGRYTNDNSTMDILIIRLKREDSVERARSTQRNFIAGYLKGDYGSTTMKDAALVAFVSPDDKDWRFSLVKMDYRFEENASGKMRVKEDFTPARRWSFLVGENEKSHTAQSRLYPLLINDDKQPTIEDLTEAFNIETVTKEFFQNYRELFIRLKIQLDEIIERDPDITNDFTEKGIDSVNFSKKLLGQIVFLYFIQKKGWFGVPKRGEWGTGSRHFLRELFDKRHGDYKNFFNDILEPLFYEALRMDRGHDDNYYSRFDCKIPFLNGGLFDPIGNYDWSKTDIVLPDELFSNQKKTKNGDVGDGILDIFDRFNFTVREDEPLDKEVAIDPELLGKAYEKFNAIRPDNFDEYQKSVGSVKENKFNKEFGVYYTPREIVHYMCQKSLEYYLKEEFKNTIPETDMEDFVSKAESVLEHELVYQKKLKQIEAGEIKKTDYAPELPASVLTHLNDIDNKLEDIRICDPAVGSGAFPVGLMTEIVRLRSAIHILSTGTIPPLYDIKRNCIEKSIYGVDIDPGAVEIARLRLWLSLVVDEEAIENVKPLPNLDYKLVRGNSLLGLPYEPNWIEDLEKLKKTFFEETNPTKKNDFKNQINAQIQKSLKAAEASIGYKIDFDFKLFFSEVFHEKGGFDVVIGNPPYVDSETLVKCQPEFRKKITEIYSSAKGNWDLYIPFLELGHNLLQPGGFFCYITPNKWFGIGYGKEIVKKLIGVMIRVGNCNLIKVFEAGNSPVITIISKNKLFSSIVVDNIMEGYCIHKPVIVKKKLVEGNLGLVLANNLPLALKIKKSLGTISSYYEAQNPCSVSEAYELKSILTDGTMHSNSEIDTYFKFVNTGTVEPFYSLWGKADTTYLKGKYSYPVISRKKYQNTFPRRYAQMAKPKIVISGMRHFESFLDQEGIYIAGKSTEMLFQKGSLDLKVALAICNSKLIRYYINEAYSVLGIDGGINFTTELIDNLPFPEINDRNASMLISSVEEIIKITLKDEFPANSKVAQKYDILRNQIDRLVYQLYGLTEEEIKIIEDSTK